MYSHTQRLPGDWSEHEDPEQNPIPHSERKIHISVTLYL
jgi:hypothetical protein